MIRTYFFDQIRRKGDKTDFFNSQNLKKRIFKHKNQ